ncbi:ABC transporter permease [Gaoshiqia sediminis]|uniref:ABC transporter permease n=1 Tax=Gaoshiqia sediminis TaxID=2986998 RepID=A0AA41Y554_9BACT|nr:ABC transporter permease [Gaoshiqia sediminis]MCW0481282.1 ABC transporter permease [Gaoshiqia sediminis]
MRTIRYILQKEFIQVFRNKTMLPMIFVLPLMQMLVLVFAATYDLKNVDIYVVDNDLSETSRELTGRFQGSPFFRLHDASFDLEDAENSFKREEADFVMVILQGFERALVREDEANVQLLINAIDGSKASLVYSYAQGILSGFNKAVIAEWKGLPEFNPPRRIDSKQSYWYNPELDYKWYMAPGILAILVTIIGMFLSGMNLVREKEIGTIEQLNVTPIKKYQFILGKLLPFLVIALFDLAFGLVIARLVFDLPIVGSLPLLFGFAALYLIGVLGLGLFISTVTETQQQVMFLTFFFMMIFVLMGGIFTPVESMPRWAQLLDRLNPIYYFMRIMRMVVLKGSGFSDLIDEFVSLILIGLSFLSLAIWRYRKTN